MKDVFLDKVGNTFVEEISLSDDEPEPDSMEDAENAGSRGVMVRRRTRSCLRCLVLEQCAESRGMHMAGHFLLKAKIIFLAARAAKPARQSDIRSFTSS